MVKVFAVLFPHHQDCTSRSRHLDFHRVATSSGAISDIANGVCGYDISDVSDACIVQVQIAEIALACDDQDTAELENCSLALALGEGLHSRLDKVELLLQVVKANLRVNAVPVQHPVVDKD